MFGLSSTQFALVMVEVGLAGDFVDLGPEDQERVKQKSNDLYLGTAFILMSNRRQTTPLIDHFKNQYLEKSTGSLNVGAGQNHLLMDTTDY
mmetsp:Transcript_37237/g.52592  ORF Transcript_37237/g.52592 Transcript_37237/m.52592 type:complete len:91 (-) Transcript_37237:52-324(-)